MPLSYYTLYLYPEQWAAQVAYETVPKQQNQERGKKMNVFYEAIYMLCVVVSVLCVVSVIGAPLMGFSTLAILAHTWDLIVGLCTFKIQTAIKSIKEHDSAVRDICGAWTYIPGICFIITVVFFPTYHRYDEARHPAIDGTYAKIVHIKDISYTTGRDTSTVYHVDLNIGYGQIRDAVFIRESGPFTEKISVGSILLVACPDGKTWRERIENRRIVPTLSTWL